MKKREWALLGVIVLVFALMIGSGYLSRQYDHVYSISPGIYFITLPMVALAFLYRNDRRWVRRTAWIGCVVLWGAMFSSYLFFLPEYTAEKAVQVVAADPRFSEGKVIHTGAAYLDQGGRNPLYRGGYALGYESETVSGRIQFDMVTGEYAFFESSDEI